MESMIVTQHAIMREPYKGNSCFANLCNEVRIEINNEALYFYYTHTLVRQIRTHAGFCHSGSSIRLRVITNHVFPRPYVRSTKRMFTVSVMQMITDNTYYFVSHVWQTGHRICCTKTKLNV